MLVDTLADVAAEAPSLAAFRHRVLDLLRVEVPFDGAFIHALSPRVPLSSAVFRGIDPASIAASVGSWDEFGSTFAALRERAHRERVATDQALPKRARATLVAKVLAPLGMRSMAVVHLVVRGHFVAAVVLFARRSLAFAERQVAALRRASALIAVGDALHQRLDGIPTPAVPTALRCLDQRLTPRQREIVELVAVGHTNAAIGEALGLTPTAVRNHLVRVFARLGASNRADVVRLAVLTSAG